MEISANSQLLHLELARASAFAGSAQRVVLRVVQIIDVADVRAEFSRKSFRFQRRILGAAVAVEPREVGKRKWLFASIARRTFGSFLCRRSKRAVLCCRIAGRCCLTSHASFQFRNPFLQLLDLLQQLPDLIRCCWCPLTLLPQN